MSVLRILSLSFISTFAPTGIISNAIVLVAFYKQELRNDCSYIFFMHLAIVDLLLCSGGLIMGLGIYQIGGFVFCKGGLVFTALFYGLSSGTLCLMTIDRYIYISTPLRYYCKMTARRAKLLIAGIWGLSIINIIPVITGTAFKRSPGPYHHLDIKNCVLPKIINIPYFFWMETTFMLFLATTIFLNFRILSYARHQSRKIEATTPTENVTSIEETFSTNFQSQTLANKSLCGTLRGTFRRNGAIFWRQNGKLGLAKIFLRIRHKKYVKTIVCIVLIHCICNLPYFLFVTSELLCESGFEYKRVKYAYSLCLLNYFNSVLNPVIYTSLNGNLRKSVKKLFFSICCRS